MVDVELGLMSERELAEKLKISLATLRAWRRNKRGPAFVRMGKAIKYRVDDVKDWLDGQRVDPKTEEVVE